MILLKVLYDEYIDRPKLTEQKKPIRVYSSPPHKWGRNNYFARWYKISLDGMRCQTLETNESYRMNKTAFDFCFFFHY